MPLLSFWVLGLLWSGAVLSGAEDGFDWPLLLGAMFESEEPEPEELDPGLERVPPELGDGVTWSELVSVSLLLPLMGTALVSSSLGLVPSVVPG